MISDEFFPLPVAIEQLYRAFDRYPLRFTVDGCPHCVSSRDNSCIHDAPLRELAAGQLARFAFKAMTTWGTVDDFRHFLPRIFELLAMDAEKEWIDPEPVFAKLNYGKFRSWPTDEQRSIDQYCWSLWNNVICKPFNPFPIERLINCIAMVAQDIGPYLAVWQPARSEGEAMQFVFLTDSWAGENPTRRRRFTLHGGWWNKCEDQARQIESWFISPDRLRGLENAFYKFGDDSGYATALSDAFNNLNYLQTYGAKHAGGIS